MDSNNILDKIIDTKRQRLAKSKSERSIDSLRREALDIRQTAHQHALRTALEDDTKINIIAEVKRASPSKGVIRNDISPAEVAKAYQSGGASAISVLTEEDYFLGSLDDLRCVRSAVSLPILRKDFIFDEYQLYEAAATRADALLLIVAALDDEHLSRLRQITEDELGMDALVEVHTASELYRAKACGATIIGVNNRDLRSFKVSLDVSVELSRNIPPNTLLVAESGIQNGNDIKRLRSCGYKGFLIGETLMRADRIEDSLKALLETQ
jgi:indole-3-glycerol phosphate synthase